MPLQPARALALLGKRAKSVVPVMKKVTEKNRSQPGSKRPYKDFSYAPFIGWALETGLLTRGKTKHMEPFWPRKSEG